MNLHTFSPQTCKDSQAKQATRDRTLRNVKAMKQMHPDGYLTQDWIDLCGYQDETLQGLLRENLLVPGKGRYLGVNLCPQVIAANNVFFADAVKQGLCEFRQGDWQHLVRDPWADKATIITYDGFASVARQQLKSTLSSTIIQAKGQKVNYGQVLLYLNLSRPRQADPTDYLKFIQETFDCTIPPEQVVIYRSKVIPMVSLWLRLGF